MATFLFTVFLDVDLGLLVGLVVSLLFLIAWGYFPKIEVIGQTQHQDLFTEEGSFKQVINTQILIDKNYNCKLEKSKASFRQALRLTIFSNTCPYLCVELPKWRPSSSVI